MDIETIDMTYSPGSAKEQEDGLIANYPFFGVVDAFSAPYDPEDKGPTLFDGLSGGEMIRQIIIDTFHFAQGNDSLEKVAIRANKKIADFQIIKNKIPVNRTDLLAGASFAFAKIIPGKSSIEVIQGGDCIAGWTHNFTNINFTPNRAYSHDSETIKTMAGIMEKNNGSRNGLWKDFCPLLRELRMKDQNQLHSKDGFSVLNGQSEAEKLWYKTSVPIKNLDILLLFSDGFVPDVKTGVTEKSIIKAIMSYRNGNLSDILKKTRSSQVLKENKSHVDLPEATALGIRFLREPKNKPL